MEQHSYNLIMPFLDDSQNFCFGFECGQIWLKCEKEIEFENYLIHTKNKEQIQMICSNFSYIYKIDYLNDDWSYLTATKSVGKTIH